MGVYYNPSISSVSDLILHLDAANPKSYSSGFSQWVNISNSSFGNMQPVSGFNSQCQWNANGYFSINSATDNPQANAIAASTNNAHIYHAVPSEYWMGNNTQNRTYEAWFRINNVSQTNGPIFRTMVGTGCSYACNGGIEYNNGSINFTHFDNSAYHLTGNYSLSNGQWVHVVGTVNWGENPNKKVYVNGELNASMNTSNFNYSGGGSYIEIGFNRKSNAPRVFNGDIAVIRMYMDRALTDAQVKTNFNALRRRFGI